MWVLVHENTAWQITSEDPTGLWGEDYIWVDIGENPENIQETWVAKQNKAGVWSFKPYEAPKPSKQELVAANHAKYELLSNKASVMLTPLLVALQLGDATEEEINKARDWQQYYRNLKVVDLSSSNIIWPESPEPI